MHGDRHIAREPPPKPLSITARRLSGRRQRDLKGSPGSLDAAEAQRTIVLLDDAPADPQTKPGSLCRFRREERFEEMFCILRTDSIAGVRDHDAHARLLAPTIPSLSNRDPDAAALRGSLNRISYQVHEDLL